MATDQRVDLAFSHNGPRYVATGVDPNDMARIKAQIDDWLDWCKVWSAEARRHEDLAKAAADAGREVTAAEAYLRAAIYYHYGKHMYADHPNQFRMAHDNMLRCYTAAAPHLDPPLERVLIPYQGVQMAAWLRKPRNGDKPPVAIILPGLDACKEELHAWAEAFVARGMAALTLDGPGQGETSFHLPTTHEWGKVIGAVIDELEKRTDVDGHRVGIVGQSLGAIYAPLAASGEPRLKACIANCGPYDWGQVLPKMPPVSQEVFRVRSHAKDLNEAHEIAKLITMEGNAPRITCPLLVVYGAGDALMSPKEGERLAKAASGPSEFVLYEEGNHVCFNISYKFRPLTGDWMADKLFGAKTT